MCCCRPRPGARRTARSPIRSGASRASARSCRCPAKPGRTGGSSSEVARRMGFADAFAYRSAADVFREHAALVGVRERRHARLRSRRPRATSRTTTTTRSRRCSGRCARASAPSERRFFADGGFFTPDRKARFVAPEPPALREATSADVSAPAQHRPHPRPVAHHDAHRHEPAARRRICRSRSSRCIRDDAARAGLADGGFARVATAARRLRAQGRASATASSRARCSCRSTGAARPPRRARVGDLVAPHTDPYSGQPEAKATPAAIAPVALPLRGFARTRRAVALPAGTWWARVAVADGAEYRLATSHGPMVWHDFAYRALAGDAALAEQLDGAVYRAAAFVDGELDGCLFVGPADAAAAMGHSRALRRRRRRAADARAISTDADRRDRAGDLRLLRRRRRRGPRRGRLRRGANRRGDRPHAARRHQLRLVPARTETNSIVHERIAHPD